MHIFSRTIRLAPGDPRHQLDWAFRITEKVNQISEVPVRCWTPVMSPQVGTIAWGLGVERLAQLEALDDKLMADDGYLDLVTEGAKYVTQDGPSDSLVRLLHADTGLNPALTQYILATTATAAPGQETKAAQIGVEIAKRASSISGVPGTFGICETGPYGTFQWATYCESIEQFEAGNEAVQTDTSFAEFTSKEASSVFQGGASSALVRKLA